VDTSLDTAFKLGKQLLDRRCSTDASKGRTRYNILIAAPAQILLASASLHVTLSAKQAFSE